MKKKTVFGVKGDLPGATEIASSCFIPGVLIDGETQLQKIIL